MQQAQPAVVADELGVHLIGEREMVAAGAVGTDVPRPAGVGGGGEVAGQQIGSVAEAAAGDDHRVSRDLVVADGHAAHRPAVIGEQPVHPPAERDVHPRVAAAGGEQVDHRLPAPDRDMHPRHRLVAAVDEVGVELQPHVAQPLDGVAGLACQPARRGHLEVPAVELEVVAEQPVAVVLDAGGPLVAGAGAHHQAAGQSRGAAHHTLGFGHQDPRRAGLGGGQRRAQPRRARADDEHVDVHLTHVELPLFL